MAKRRKKAAGGGGGGGMSAEDAFAVMFTSLNLILLSFFILLNSIAVVDNNRQRRALGSLRGSFGILLGGENPDSNSGKSLHREMPFEMQQGAEGGKMLREAQALVSRTRLVHGEDFGGPVFALPWKVLGPQLEKSYAALNRALAREVERRDR